MENTYISEQVYAPNKNTELPAFIVCQMDAVEMFRSDVSKIEHREISNDEAYLEWIEDDYASQWRKNWDSHTDPSGKPTLTTKEMYNITVGINSYKPLGSLPENLHKPNSLETAINAA